MLLVGSVNMQSACGMELQLFPFCYQQKYNSPDLAEQLLLLPVFDDFLSVLAYTAH